MTKAAESFTRLSKLLDLLKAHPGGLPMSYLAEQIGVPEAKLRDEIIDFFAAETMTVRQDTIVFESSFGREDDPASAERVRVVADQPTEELGVEFLPADEWLRIYETASVMADENNDLSAALDIITGQILGGLPQRPESDLGVALAHSIEHRQSVRMVYSRAWQPGVKEYLVDPLRLVQTRRGWELDGLVDGQLRTFILDRVRDIEITALTFEPPADIGVALAEHRRPVTVQLVIPHEGYRWVVDRYAESAVWTRNKADWVVEAQFLPPVGERVGLILITAPDSMAITPPEFAEAGREMAERLLKHHGL